MYRRLVIRLAGNDKLASFYYAAAEIGYSSCSVLNTNDYGYAHPAFESHIITSHNLIRFRIPHKVGSDKCCKM
ncbi:hypothetical protein RSOLAG1IB_11553 [Rhizoctonia solani AG-1 IB]|uniref:Uncharacterized protein n=1 Tax=Thanatephorus cucumeris (strain AG1-IB / isolate 7/3/14) TaxID=1108050 RepID=A0A0B7F7I5_THACB|nr:hypothetical protein RSOLAG1IB_11553 [Rhizoctonia solani AG-1 IB]